MTILKMQPLVAPVSTQGFDVTCAHAFLYVQNPFQIIRVQLIEVLLHM